MKYYEIIVHDFWSGVILGTFGTYGTVRQAENEGLDLDAELKDGLLFSYEVAPIGTSRKRYELTRGELVSLGEMMKARNGFNTV